jgi:hypothetical protein
MHLAGKIIWPPNLWCDMWLSIYPFIHPSIYSSLYLSIYLICHLAIYHHNSLDVAWAPNVSMVLTSLSSVFHTPQRFFQNIKISTFFLLWQSFLWFFTRVKFTSSSWFFFAYFHLHSWFLPLHWSLGSGVDWSSVPFLMLAMWDSLAWCLEWAHLLWSGYISMPFPKFIYPCFGSPLCLVSLCFTF